MASICFALRLSFAMEKIFPPNLFAGLLNFEQFLETMRRKKNPRYRSGNAPSGSKELRACVIGRRFLIDRGDLDRSIDARLSERMS